MTHPRGSVSWTELVSWRSSNLACSAFLRHPLRGSSARPELGCGRRSLVRRGSGGRDRDRHAGPAVRTTRLPAAVSPRWARRSVIGTVAGSPEPSRVGPRPVRRDPGRSCVLLAAVLPRSEVAEHAAASRQPGPADLDMTRALSGLFAAVQPSAAMERCMSEMTHPVVRLKDGTVRGQAESGVSAFLGIPYAAAPFGPNRMRPPQPVQAWDGERDATGFGPTVPKGDYPPQYATAVPGGGDPR